MKKETHDKCVAVITALAVFILTSAMTYCATKLVHLPSWWWIFYVLAAALAIRILIVEFKDIKYKGEIDNPFFTIAVATGLITSFSALLLPFTLIILLLIYIDSLYFHLIPDNYATRPEDKAKKEAEKEKKRKVGLKSNEEYLSFQKMGGCGTIKCRKCGYIEKEVISFVHGAYECEIGRQCPNCHSFVAEYNSSEKYHTFGDAKEDFYCPNCGALIRKKEESISKGDDEPLVCPKCQSPRLSYWMEYIT